MGLNWEIIYISKTGNGGEKIFLYYLYKTES